MTTRIPKISVIIPVYNAERFLRQTLESVLSQSLKEIEVICVDDGSTDNSIEILQEYERKDERVKVVRQENLHAGVARNNGLAVAAGEYVHFLDADDYVLDYAYEALYNKVVKYDLDCVKFCSITYDMGQEIAVEVPANSLSGLGAGDFNRLVTAESGSPIYKVNVVPWNGIYRRAFLEEKHIRFNDLFCVNDRSFFCKVVTNARRVMIARDSLVAHRMNIPDSLIGVRARHFDCHFRSIEIVSQQLIDDEVDETIKRLIMKREFNDLFVWYRRYCGDSESGGKISAETKNFVETYRGLYPYLLQDMYRDALKKVKDTGGGTQSSQAPALFPLHRERVQRPLVSVVLPIYNVEDYLNEALYSLMTQKLGEMEFLCVNDGSTDGSLAIIKEYAALDERFRILDGPNGGYGKAMNRGIDAATGEYLGILEPDDFVPFDMFQKLYQIAHRENLDFVKADFYRFTVSPTGHLQKKKFKLSSNAGYYGRLVNPSEDLATFLFVMNTWSGIYSLKFLNKWHIRHNETPGASYQDNGFWFQTFCRAKRAWFIDTPYYMNRRDNPNSSMFNRKKIYCVTDEYRYIWNWLSQEPVLTEKYSRIFYMKKFSNFMVTYHRLAPEYQLEYLHHVCDEFEPVLESGLLDEKLFGKLLWKQLKEILADPDAYNEKIRISVIMPVYNASSYLRQTLDSILVRNEVQMELICVDDGSTDDSLNILHDYERVDTRVKVFTQENRGAGAARNHGMQYARGEYLSFLDADDFFEPDMLRRAYEKSYICDADIVVFRSDQYMEETRTFVPAGYTINKALLPGGQPFAGEEIDKNVFRAFVGWAWDKLFRADFVRENGLQFQEQRTTNDMLFVFSAIVKAKRICTMDQILAHHRRSSASLSVTREESWDCFYRALLALRQQMKDWGMYERLERDFINYSLHFSLWNLTTLRGSAYHKLFGKLKTEWLDDLGITRYGADYFYNTVEYRALQELLACDSLGFLRCRLDDAQGEMAGLRKKNVECGNTLRTKDSRIKSLEREKKKLAADKSRLLHSRSYRLGRFLSAPYRWLKMMIRG